MIHVTIPRYLKYVTLSEEQKPTYYRRPKAGKELPVKYKPFRYDAGNYLIDAMGNRIVKNVRSVGTPKLKKINGQDLYSGMMAPYMRSKIVIAIKESFRPYVKSLPVLKYPLRISLQMHDVIGRGDWDLDNLWLYNKCFQDVLVSEGKIPDDSVLYVTAAAAPEFCPVDDDSQRKLVFTLEEETRPIILTNPRYVTPVSVESIRPKRVKLPVVSVVQSGTTVRKRKKVLPAVVPG